MANWSPGWWMWSAMLAFGTPATAAPEAPSNPAKDEHGIIVRWEPLAESRWEDGRPFFEGRAAVKRREKWGFIDKNGTFVLPPRWDFTVDFSGGVASVQLNEEWGVIDRKGQWIIAAEWGNIFDYSGRLFAVQKDGMWGLIDRSGRMIASPRWNWTYPYRGDYCFVSGPGGAGYLDKNGKMVIEGPWRKGSNVTNGLAVVKERETGKSVYIRIWNEVR